MFLRLDNVAPSNQFRHARDKVTQIPLPPLARSALDRDYLSREIPNLFESLRDSPNALALVMHQGKVLLEKNTEGRLALIPFASAPAGELEVYLGKSSESSEMLQAQVPVSLVVINQADADALEPDESAWVSLRSIGAELSDFEAGLLTEALALSNWHSLHAHCPRCGSETQVQRAGWVRRCQLDELELFPRTDPAVIVSILDQSDRILLGSQGIWEENRWSILAGFVEPGESLEAAVVREMAEECGLVVSNPEYIYSQSWPYPYSLMLGFQATADSSQPLIPDGEEIVRLRWFSRDELRAEAKELLLPGRATISRAMIELWFGGEIISGAELKNHGQSQR